MKQKLLSSQSICAIAFYLFLCQAATLRAQDITADPVAYLESIGKINMAIVKDYLSYSSAVAHDKNAQKIEQRRKALMKTSNEAIEKVSALPDYKGDKSLRDSSKTFLQLSYHVLNEDYGKIVNLEEIAEQSYDAMEAYLLAQEMANEKLNNANKKLILVEKSFAKKNNITLLEMKDDISLKLDATKKVNDYHQKLYLIFFKSYIQENYLVEAVSKGDINSIEQNKNALGTTSGEGLNKLNTLPAFEGDQSLVLGAKELLEFYKSEATEKIKDVSNYIIHKENYEKRKKVMDNMKDTERTKEVVKEFNQSVDAYNKSVNTFNKTSKYL